MASNVDNQAEAEDPITRKKKTFERPKFRKNKNTGRTRPLKRRRPLQKNNLQEARRECANLSEKAKSQAGVDPKRTGGTSQTGVWGGGKEWH